nr:hypothetical protein [Streptomyces albus]
MDALLGRSKPKRPDLDQLFALPAAALTLQAGTSFVPTGVGAVCFASVEGGAFTRLQGDVRELLDADTGRGGVPVEFGRDDYGYTWLTARHPADDMASLVNDLHAVNTLLAEGGFGPQLLCSIVAFREGSGEEPARTSPRTLALIYLYKRGTFYPFAPVPGGAEKRDNALELQVSGLLANDLPVEEYLGRWFPVWGAPGM